MSFTSLSFLGIYFPLLIIAYYNPIFKSNSYRKVLLLSTNIAFYAFCTKFYIVLLVGEIIVNFFIVKLAEKYKNDIFRAIAIVLDVFILLFYKYSNILVSTFIQKDIISPILFPIGLSYFTFKTISYVVDSNHAKSGTLLDVAIYISSFLTIVSGPLSMYEDELIYIQKKENINSDLLYSACERLLQDWVKKSSLLIA